MSIFKDVYICKFSGHFLSKMTSSQCSFRSMEILSPEPPKELSIDLESEPESTNSKKDRKPKKSKKSKVRSPPTPTDDEIELGRKLIDKYERSGS